MLEQNGTKFILNDSSENLAETMIFKLEFRGLN